MSPERAETEVLGRTTSLLRVGPVEGPGVMLLHGVPTNSELWLPVMERLDGVRAVAPDLPGYGESQPPGTPHLLQYHRFITELARGDGLGSFVLVGHDLGGLYALTYALSNPAALRALVLLNTSIYVDPHVLLGLAPLLDPGFGEVYAWLAGTGRYGPLVRRGLEGMYPQGTPAKLVKGLTKPYTQTSAWLSLLRSLRGLSPLHVLRLRRRMGRLELPVLILWGEADPYFPASVPARLHGDLPSSTVRHVCGGGHFLMLSQPSVVADAVRDIVARTT